MALGADVRATNKDGSTALRLLCCNGEATPARLQLLVREHGLDVDARGFHKRTPLRAMCKQNDAVSCWGRWLRWARTCARRTTTKRLRCIC